MALSTFTELKAAIASWLNRDDLTTTIPDFITLAEGYMKAKLVEGNVRQTIIRAEATIDSEFVSVPTDFVSPISMTIEAAEDDINTLEFIADERVLAAKASNTTEDEPTHYTVVGEEFRFYPIPDTSYTAELVYKGVFPALGASQATNWLLTRYPNCYLYGALVHSAPFLKNDERLETWAALFTESLDAVIRAARLPGGKLKTDLPSALFRTSYNINTDV